MYNARDMVRVRIAPSPTGIPHIGNTRTALFNYLFAKHNKGKFIVRIEDTDQARIVEGAKEAIFEILDWLGMSWDEEYTQSDRKDIYDDYISQLLKKGVAYKDEGAVRFKIPENQEISWIDEVGKKKISFKTDVIEDFVILKSDGFPTYHFANVIDDHLMDISHVIRGDEWISSTPKHIMLYQAFNWKVPIFAHLPVILGPDKTKLSKRHGARSVLDLRNDGYLKEAIINFMGILGWSPGEDKEIMDISEMIKLFELEKVNLNSPIFDNNKLLWFNGEYIRSLKKEEFNERLVKFYKNDNEVISIIKNNNQDNNSLIDLAKTRMKTLKDFKDLVIPKIPNLSSHEKKTAKIILEKFSAINNWNKGAILSEMKNVLKEQNIKGNVLYKIITGHESGLPLPESLEILGKEKSLERIKKTSIN